MLQISRKKARREALKASLAKIATWNVQGGLREQSNRETMERDLLRLKVDVACLQETRFLDDGHFHMPQGGHILALAGQDESIHKRYGQGFYISARWWEHLTGTKRISDRISYITFNIGAEGNLTIINVYAPTAKYAEDHQEEYAEFHLALRETIRTCRPKAAILMLAGDFNSIIGKRRENEAFMGSHSRGLRNANGRALATLLEQESLFLTNTAFKHPLKHISTWHGFMNRGENNRAVHNQIDYIAIQQSKKKLVTQARAYTGSEMSSDHSIVISSLQLEILPHTAPKKKPKSVPRLDLTALSRDPEIAEFFSQRLSAKLVEAETLDFFDTANPVFTPTLRENIINEACETAAKESLPLAPTKQNGKLVFHHDVELKRLSKRQMHLRKILISKKNMSASARRQMVKLRRETQKLVRKRLHQLTQNHYAALATELEANNLNQRSYEINRILQRKSSGLQLQDEEGKMQYNPHILIRLLRNWYESFFNQPGIGGGDPWLGEPRLLEEEITVDEVKAGASRLRNNRAAGFNKLNSELFKHGGDALCFHIALLLNSIFRTHTALESIGQGILIAINKPGKTRTANNTRPVVLLNVMRKILSQIVLQRIMPNVAEYISLEQSGFRPGRSTADVVWSFRWMMAITQRYKETFQVAGIDLEKAFDSLDRGLLLDILRDECHISESNLRIIKFLLSNTKLYPRVQDFLGAPFETTIGSPQGCGLSPILFLVYFEYVLRNFHKVATAHPSPTWPRPETRYLEVAYADDAYFCVGCQGSHVRIRQQRTAPFFNRLPLSLRSCSMCMSAKKSIVFLLSRSINAKNKTKVLGNLLGPALDVDHKIEAATSAFNKSWKLWKQKRQSP